MPMVTSKSSSVLSSGGMKTPALFTSTCKGAPLSRNLFEKSLMELQHADHIGASAVLRELLSVLINISHG